MLYRMTTFVCRYRNGGQGPAFELVAGQSYRQGQWVVVIADFANLDRNFVQFITVEQVACEFTTTTGKISFRVAVIVV